MTAPSAPSASESIRKFAEQMQAEIYEAQRVGDKIGKTMPVHRKYLKREDSIAKHDQEAAYAADQARLLRTAVPELIAHVRALQAQLDAVREWQPIETAPASEAEPILVLIPVDVTERVAVQATRFGGRLYPDHLGACVGHRDAIDNATHWMPLLAPPEAGTKGEG